MTEDTDEESKIVVKKVGVVKQGACCFCSQVTDVIASEIDPTKTVCFRCVYKINFQLGKLPAGSICCFKCKSIAGFQVKTHTDKEYNYSMVGRDFKGCIKYEMKEKAQSPKGRIKQVTCTSCQANIPKWMLDFTSHV